MYYPVCFIIFHPDITFKPYHVHDNTDDTILSPLFPPDRPWLTDVQKVQKLQDKVYVALQRCLQKEGASEDKLAKVQRLPARWKYLFYL